MRAVFTMTVMLLLFAAAGWGVQAAVRRWGERRDRANLGAVLEPLLDDCDLAIDEGMLTLRMDGWLKVLKGITTLEQVIQNTPIKHVVVTAMGDQLGGLYGTWITLAVRHLAKMVPPYKLPLDNGRTVTPWPQVVAEGRGRQLAPDPSTLDSIAFLQYTGGTTGVSKGAMLTHRNMVANTQQIIDVLVQVVSPRDHRTTGGPLVAPHRHPDGWPRAGRGRLLHSPGARPGAGQGRARGGHRRFARLLARREDRGRVAGAQPFPDASRAVYRGV